MKKLIFTLLLALSTLIGSAQLRVVFFNDIPPDQIDMIHKYVDKVIPYYFPNEKLTYFTHAAVEAYCKTGMENSDTYMNAIRDEQFNTIGITYARLSYHCTEEEIYGVSKTQAGVVSAYSLGNLERLLKTVVHELGHLYGLDHCLIKGCLMEAGGSDDVLAVIDAEKDLCTKCKKLLSYLTK